METLRPMRRKLFSTRPESGKASRGLWVAPFFAAWRSKNIAFLKAMTFQLFTAETAVDDYTALKVSPALAFSAAMIIGPRENSPRAVLFVRSRR
jgi:hypothetical protein